MKTFGTSAGKTVFTGNGPLAHAADGSYRDMLASSGLTQTNLMQYAISSVSSSAVGSAFVAVCLFFFAFSTVIVWNLFGRLNCSYLWGKRSIPVYSVVAVTLIFLRYDHEKRFRLGTSGSVESADGTAQRGCADRSFRHGRGGVTPELTAQTDPARILRGLLKTADHSSSSCIIFPADA